VSLNVDVRFNTHTHTHIYIYFTLLNSAELKSINRVSTLLVDSEKIISK
jgi:hypothetical protein